MAEEKNIELEELTNKVQRVGYVRVSSAEQNLDRQMQTMKAEKLDRIFEDRVSGTTQARPGLDEMLRYVRQGDTVVVASIDRLARNIRHLHQLIDELAARGVQIQFLREGLTFGQGKDRISNLMLDILASLAEFERDHIRERQLEGIAIAKSQGKYKGRKRELDGDQIAELRSRAQSTRNLSELAKEYGISRTTLYRYLNEPGESNESTD